MFDLFFLVSTIFAGKELIKEKLEKPTPKGTRFDWDAYYKDIENGITCREQIKKQQQGGYYTTKPIPVGRNEYGHLPYNAIVDVEAYEQEKAMYGEEIVNDWANQGRYRYKLRDGNNL